ncbi:MAG: lysoplasmalogenase [Chloroflexi bacterium]|jgi:uncharacterized membrane protein YhhN|nr:lysoplasmalogenase [Anaerolineaceae bacterium]NLI44510.1 lysoplasmalogenase [Chloroflexota bacterium]HOE35380.1 lysoplasmalogenase [Anaerolineaceae bacterium]HOT26070.1 lysoplasmalogenase [Anaerolineaceae bacterium]HQK03912.1 lysoplasmalogenase [Anaerolineaceae bacterium]
MTGAEIALAALLLLGAALNWYAAWTLKLKLYFATKPAVLVILIALYIVWAGAPPPALPFLIGFGFSLLGDIFLIPRSPRWFLAGLSAFFFAHLAYIHGFTAAPAPILPTALIGACAGALLAVLSAYILRKTRSKPELKPMRRVFLPYAPVLVIMAASAVLCFFRSGWPLQAAALSAIGALLFLISDFMHAADRLGKRIPRVKFWIIATYHIGQMLIALGTAQWALHVSAV